MMIYIHALDKIYIFGFTLDVLIPGMHSQITKGTVAATLSNDVVGFCSLHVCTCQCGCVQAIDTVVESHGDALAAAPLLLKGQTDVTLQ